MIINQQIIADLDNLKLFEVSTKSNRQAATWKQGNYSTSLREANIVLALVHTGNYYYIDKWNRESNLYFNPDDEQSITLVSQAPFVKGNFLSAFLQWHTSEYMFREVKLIDENVSNWLSKQEINKVEICKDGVNWEKFNDTKFSPVTINITFSVDDIVKLIETLTPSHKIINPTDALALFNQFIHPNIRNCLSGYERSVLDDFVSNYVKIEFNTDYNVGGVKLRAPNLNSNSWNIITILEWNLPTSTDIKNVFIDAVKDGDQIEYLEYNLNYDKWLIREHNVIFVDPCKGNGFYWEGVSIADSIKLREDLFSFKFGTKHSYFPLKVTSKVEEDNQSENFLLQELTNNLSFITHYKTSAISNDSSPEESLFSNIIMINEGIRDEYSYKDYELLDYHCLLWIIFQDFTKQGIINKDNLEEAPDLIFNTLVNNRDVNNSYMEKFLNDQFISNQFRDDIYTISNYLNDNIDGNNLMVETNIKQSLLKFGNFIEENKDEWSLNTPKYFRDGMTKIEELLEETMELIKKLSSNGIYFICSLIGRLLQIAYTNDDPVSIDYSNDNNRNFDFYPFMDGFITVSSNSYNLLDREEKIIKTINYDKIPEKIEKIAFKFLDIIFTIDDYLDDEIFLLFIRKNRSIMYVDQYGIELTYVSDNVKSIKNFRNENSFVTYRVRLYPVISSTLLVPINETSSDESPSGQLPLSIWTESIRTGFSYLFRNWSFLALTATDDARWYEIIRLKKRSYGNDNYGPILNNQESKKFIDYCTYMGVTNFDRDIEYKWGNTTNYKSKCFKDLDVDSEHWYDKPLHLNIETGKPIIMDKLEFIHVQTAFEIIFLKNDFKLPFNSKNTSSFINAMTSVYTQQLLGNSNWKRIAEGFNTQLTIFFMKSISNKLISVARTIQDVLVNQIVIINSRSGVSQLAQSAKLDPAKLKELNKLADKMTGKAAKMTPLLMNIAKAALFIQIGLTAVNILTSLISLVSILKKRFMMELNYTRVSNSEYIDFISYVFGMPQHYLDVYLQLSDDVPKTRYNYKTNTKLAALSTLKGITKYALAFKNLGIGLSSSTVSAFSSVSSIVYNNVNNPGQKIPWQQIIELLLVIIKGLGFDKDSGEKDIGTNLQGYY